jgi:hypothetical protein
MVTSCFVQRSAQRGLAESCVILKPEMRGSEPCHAASRAVALDVRVAVSDELFEIGVQRVHD